MGAHLAGEAPRAAGAGACARRVARAAEAVPTDACDELVDELLSFFADDEKGNGSEEASELFRLLREL